jgi:curved DNA-binding protein CbpA
MWRKLRRMIDYFTLLQQPRRPWLDPEELKQKHQQLTLATHPDRPGANELKEREADSFPYSFAAINEAYRVLTDPKLRLQHFLNLEGQGPAGDQSIPRELADFFAKIGTLVQHVDALLGKLSGATSALSESLMRSEILDARKQTEQVLNELRDLYANAVNDLKQVDAMREERSQEFTEKLTKLYHRFAYLGRWIDQLRERQFQLAD